MKKIIKNNILGFILGIIFCGGIVYGVNLYKSEDIQYQPSDESWNVSNVSDALNDLYENSKNVQIGKTTVTFSGYSIDQTINFDKPFSKIPTIAISRNDIPHYVLYSITSVTTTGFTVNFSTTDDNEKNATVNWNWVAYE